MRGTRKITRTEKRDWNPIYKCAAYVVLHLNEVTTHGLSLAHYLAFSSLLSPHYKLTFNRSLICGCDSPLVIC